MNAYGVRQVKRERVLAMKDVLLGIASYDQQCQRMPAETVRSPSGKALYGWRFVINPFVHGSSRDVDFRVAWDDPANAAWATDQHNSYTGNTTETRIVALTGKGTAFDSDRISRYRQIPASLIVLVEVAHSGIHWMQPGDLDVDRLREDPDGAYWKSVRREIGFLVAFGDGEIWQLSSEVPVPQLLKFASIDEARSHDREVELGPYRLGQTSRWKTWK
jgi:hypothetical protein